MLGRRQRLRLEPPEKSPRSVLPALSPNSRGLWGATSGFSGPAVAKRAPSVTTCRQKSTFSDDACTFCPADPPRRAVRTTDDPLRRRCARFGPARRLRRRPPPERRPVAAGRLPFGLGAARWCYRSVDQREVGGERTHFRQRRIARPDHDHAPLRCTTPSLPHGGFPQSLPAWWSRRCRNSR